MKKGLFFAALILCCLLGLTGCFERSSDESDNTEGLSSMDKYEASPFKSSFSVGETVTVVQNGKNLYSLTINGVTLSDEGVLTVNYTYEHLGLDRSLYISASDLQVTDGDGNPCGVYASGDTGHDAQIVELGGQCTADVTYRLLSAKKEVTIRHYAHLLQKEAIAVFDLVVE